MSRLCRLKTASHGDDGKWAHDEIVSLRKQRDELLAALEIAYDHLLVRFTESEMHTIIPLNKIPEALAKVRKP